MTRILSYLAIKCTAILCKDDGPEGRDQVANLLSKILVDPANIEALIPQGTGERTMLYQNPDLGFCILAHNFEGPKTTPPHDHGPSWAIYAQATGETEMNDYEILLPATVETPGKVVLSRTYRLCPGDVHVYNEGSLHAPSRTGPTSLVRVEGIDMSKVKRLRYEVA
jgi:hypothetical protein